MRDGALLDWLVEGRSDDFDVRPEGCAEDRPDERADERESIRDARNTRKQLANVELPPQLREAFVKLAQAQAKALEKSTWVGGGFAKLWIDPQERLVAYINFPLTPPGDNALLVEFEERVYAAMSAKEAASR